MEASLLEQAISHHRSGDLSRAAQMYRQILQGNPQHPSALHLMGVLEMQLGRNDIAIEWIRRAIALAPNEPTFYNNLGLALINRQETDSAIDVFKRGVQLQPNGKELHFNLGIAYKAANRHLEASQSFRKAIELSPESIDYALALVHELQQLCEWNEVERLAQRVVDAVDNRNLDLAGASISPFSFLSLPIPTTAPQQLRCARIWTEGRQPGSTTDSHIQLRRVSEKRPASIKVGYLSADFRDHPIAYLMAELFEKHDREHFEIFGYSIGRRDGSDIGERVIRSFDHFRDLHPLTYIEAARQISLDEIDILVDLQGHTDQARVEILACRPAPIQVNYLGYAGTMGADFIDYILVDDYVVPPDQQAHFSECLVHLPGCYMVNDRQREIAPRTPTRAEVGLPDQAIVFCAFNAFYKTTRQMFDVWMRLMNAIPESVLWLREGDLNAMMNLRREARLRNVTSDRLVFAPSVSMPEHLARQRLADLFLDTFPYNQHSTACDALRVGLPVVTLSGETFASRIAGSLLRAVNLTELIANNINEYEKIAADLAKSPNKMANIRSRLQREIERTPLFDGTAFARKLEQAFRSMWQTYVDAPSSARL
ncbi:MAG: tetratricopeptide repeat protein [Pirellulaceae bacterium]|nr:tetratricopeptide repeat protein [Pirellulaceae bacterium]